MSDTTESKQSTIKEILTYCGISSTSLAIFTHLLHQLQVNRLYSIKSCIKYDNINELINNISLLPTNTTQYITISGILTTSNPITSTYHTTNNIIELLYRQVKDIHTYIKFFPLSRIPINEYKQIDIHPPTVCSTQLIQSHSPVQITTHHTTSWSNSSKSLIQQSYINLSKYILRHAEHIWVNNTLHTIGTQTIQHNSSTNDILSQLNQGRLHKSTTSIEYGIHNNSEITLIGHVKYDTQTKQLHVLHSNELSDTNNTKPTILTDQSYESFIHNETQHTHELNVVKYTLIGCSIISFTILFSKLAYELYEKTQTLQRMLQLKQQRDQRQHVLKQLKRNNNNNNNNNNELLSVDDTSDNEQTDINLCVVCANNVANCVFIDCFHQCCCSECSEQLMKRSMKCPICRCKISKYRIPIIV